MRRARRADRLREAPSVAALRRDAAARLDRAGALVLPAAPADGRAVRRARRDDARAAERRAPADLGRHRLDDRLRHALDRRGGLPLHARRRDVARGRGGSQAIVDIDLPQPRTQATREQTALRRADPRGARGCSGSAAGSTSRRTSRRGDADRRGGGAVTPPQSATGRRPSSSSCSGSRLGGRHARLRRRALPAAAALGHPADALGGARHALERRLLHLQGGARRLRDRLRRSRSSPRSCSRAGAARRRADAVHDRRQRDPDHRLRARSRTTGSGS